MLFVYIVLTLRHPSRSTQGYDMFSEVVRIEPFYILMNTKHGHKQLGNARQQKAWP
jgi:hypothetical protein